jgi:hypothetical protein
MVRAIAFVHKQQCEMRCEEGTTGWPSMGQVGWVRVSHVTDHWLRSELGVGSWELGVGSWESGDSLYRMAGGYNGCKW